jgi:hypothetical protein
MCPIKKFERAISVGHLKDELPEEVTVYCHFTRFKGESRRPQPRLGGGKRVKIEDIELSTCHKKW